MTKRAPEWTQTRKTIVTMKATTYPRTSKALSEGNHCQQKTQKLLQASHQQQQLTAHNKAGAF
jgi:hypothetical protein